MPRFARFAGSRRRSVFLCLLVAAGTGCTQGRRVTPELPETISNQDVVETQPVVSSNSFTMRNADARSQLAGGVYNVESNNWRWTARDFSIILATPRAAATHGADLVFSFSIPEAILNRTGPITLEVFLDGIEVGQTRYQTAGDQRFSARLAPELLRQSPVVIDFHLDRYVPRGVLDSRELGVVAESVRLEANEDR